MNYLGGNQFFTGVNITQVSASTFFFTTVSVDMTMNLNINEMKK